MKINTVLLVAVCAGLLLLGSGCATYNHTQYLVRGPRNIEGKPTAATALQRETVRQALADVAKKLKFQERTERSVIPDLIGTYGEEDNLNPITFTARMDKDVIVIDIMHDATTPGETQRYLRTRDAIFSELKKQMPNDVRMAERLQQR